MDLNGVIEKNREALRRILAMLVAMAGLDSRGQFTFFPQDGALSQGLALAEKSKLSPAPTLPRHLHRAILALLRPAEAAARRLVIVVARELVLPPPQPRKPKLKPVSIFVRNGGTRSGIVLPYGVKSGDILPNLAKPYKAPRSLALPLLDTLPKWPGSRRRRTTAIPRIWAPGFLEPDRTPRRPPMPHDPIDAKRLALRLGAIGRALDDLPREAQRFACWRARRDAADARIRQELEAAGVHVTAELIASVAQVRKPGRPFRRVWPLRPGRPPGDRRKPTHEVHEVLKDLHYFAFYALEQFQQNCAAVLRPELRENEETERRDTS